MKRKLTNTEIQVRPFAGAKGRALAGLALASLLLLASWRPLCADFEDTGNGARTAGMGDSFTALADDVYAVVYNPGALGEFQHSEFTASFRRLFVGLSDGSDLRESFAAYAARLGGARGGLGIAMKDFDAAGLYKETTYIISYGRNMNDALRIPLSLGASVRVLMKEYTPTVYTENAIDFNGNTYGRDPVFGSGYGKTAFGFDVGALYRFSREYRAGILINNINQPDTGLKHTSRLPLRIKAGMCYSSAGKNILLDGEFKNGDNVVAPAVEKWLFDRRFAIRGGAQVGSRELANISIGLSYLYAGLFRFDYSFSTPLNGVKDTRGSHTMSLVIFFGQGTAGKEPSDTVKPEPVIPALSAPPVTEVPAAATPEDVRPSTTVCPTQGKPVVDLVPAQVPAKTEPVPVIEKKALGGGWSAPAPVPSISKPAPSTETPVKQDEKSGRSGNAVLNDLPWKVIYPADPAEAKAVSEANKGPVRKKQRPSWLRPHKVPFYILWL